MSSYPLLEKTKWTKPDYYGGFSPDGDYLLYSRHQDSHLLDESNWDYIVETLQAEAFDDGSYTDYEGKNDSRPSVYHWRAGHRACGWVEYLMIRSDAPENIKARAESILDSLENYPILNEDDFSEREWNLAQETWENLSLSERVDLCRDAGVSIFSARLKHIPPSDDTGYIFEQCRGD